MATPTLNTQGSALLPTDNGGQASSAFGTPTALNTFTASVASGVPTAAPSGQTSTQSPTTVVSTQPAQAAVQQMQDTMTQGKTDISNQQAAKTAAAATASQTTAAAKTTATSPYDVNGNPVATTTPEQQIADTPLTGTEWVYDSKGNRSMNVIGTTPPAGYSTVNPTTGPSLPATDQTTDSVGNVYKQFSDGTYGKFNPLGAYVGTATAMDFNNSKSGESIMSSLQQVINGTYPLTANQQAQVDGIKAQFAGLINDQTTANANLTGGTTVAENLYGMGNSLAGLGEIKGTIDSGIAKIADLNSKLSSAVAQMESGFQQDDLNMVKTAYDIYSSAQKDRQDEIDKLQAAADAKVESDRSYNLQVAQMQQTHDDTIDNDIRSVMTEAQKGNATPDQMAAMTKALANHDYAGAVTAAGSSLQDPTSPAGMYAAYVNTQKAAGKTPMSAGDFIAAQKYKEAYASASASAAVQATQADKDQAKLMSSLQKAALSSRSDLGIQNKKVSSAIDLRRLFNQYENPDGTYKLPATGYTEMAVGLATLLSPTGVPAQSTIKDLQQKTAEGDWNSIYTYVTGQQASGSSQDIFKNLSNSIDGLGETSEALRNKELDAQSIGLDEDKKNAVINALPSYDDMSQGDISYQSPEQINETAVTQLASFAKTSPDAYNALKSAFPSASPTWIAQQAGLLPSAK